MLFARKHVSPRHCLLLVRIVMSAISKKHSKCCSLFNFAKTDCLINVFQFRCFVSCFLCFVAQCHHHTEAANAVHSMRHTQQQWAREKKLILLWLLIVFSFESALISDVVLVLLLLMEILFSFTLNSNHNSTFAQGQQFRIITVKSFTLCVFA